MNDISLKEGILYYIEDDNGVIEGSPFYVENNCLFNCYDKIDDGTLGKLYRNAVKIVSSKKTGIPIGERYFYYNGINSKPVRKKRQDDILDLFNMAVGNVFDKKQCENQDFDINKMKQFLTEASGLLCGEIKDVKALINVIRKELIRQKNIPYTEIENDELRGILATEFQKSRK